MHLAPNCISLFGSLGPFLMFRMDSTRTNQALISDMLRDKILDKCCIDPVEYSSGVFAAVLLQGKVNFLGRVKF